MSVIDDIQPVWRPELSISGDTYRRAWNSVPFLRRTRSSKPSRRLPRSVMSSWRCISGYASRGQYGNGATLPTRSVSSQPVIRQNAGSRA